MAPLISILTHTRNRGGTYLPRAIASVRALQLSCRYEHIVVDDASDDGTQDYLACQARQDAHLRPLFHPVRRGAAAARNSAMLAAQGTFLVVLDDDDILLAHGVEHRLQYLRTHPTYWAVHANALTIDDQDRYQIGEDMQHYLCADTERCAELFFTGALLPHPSTAMYRRQLLHELGGWDESLSCCEEYDLWLRSLDRFGPPGFLDEPVALQRKDDHAHGIDGLRSDHHAQNQRRVQQRWLHLLAPKPDHQLVDSGKVPV